MSIAFMKRTWVSLGGLMLFALQAAPAAAEKLPVVKSEIHLDTITLEVVDLSPRFLDFYGAAEAVSADARFELWKERYGFAAVPPTPAGSALARELLDAAWARYPAALPRIRQGAAALQPSPAAMIGQVAKLFAADTPAKLRLMLYVGGFEDNAFTYQAEGMPVLSLPLESSPEFIALVGRHEAAHAMHVLTAGLSGDYERSLARVVFEEGLAMRAVEAIDPGKPESYYTEHRAGWLSTAQSRQADILRGLLPVLEHRSGQEVFAFTMGEGATGLPREAYFAGWLVVGELLRAGHSFPELARVSEDAMPALVEQTLRTLLEQQKSP